ncbi:hypothetical protein GCM10009864_39600 [Streptomyces lunalinharesii]|uniref:Uncharacterized protein n=1 Tax=Streptomyces lunalinharesii TaxID=333384 RepID=A0ABN3S2H9_9ACTN
MMRAASIGLLALIPTVATPAAQAPSTTHPLAVVVPSTSHTRAVQETSAATAPTICNPSVKQYA